jgi:phage gp36-like protein
MSTPYITRAQLAAIYGEAQIAAVESGTGASVAAVIEAVSALTDAYVSKAAPLPLPEAALSMLRAPVAALVFARLYAQASTDAIRGAEKDALAFLTAIADGKVTLPVPVPADDPDTPEDESDLGAASGSSRRYMSGPALRGW